MNTFFWFVADCLGVVSFGSEKVTESIGLFELAAAADAIN